MGMAASETVNAKIANRLMRLTPQKSRRRWQLDASLSHCAHARNAVSFIALARGML
jgi:hypothetical protein